ncbi:hypothetical protein TWF481_011594 [Arthrobotrys musiformis]|uniref:Nephrocystin 3-like N-terminal domain-containing protein n=1 Tax=Arthrobotrys musiformis TaxID=47236 RepID=A0AAV9VYW2_9PEZI
MSIAALLRDINRHTYSYGEYLESIPDRLDGTGEWLSNRQEYQTWRDLDEPRILWVTANPGCGKTVTAKEAVKRLDNPEDRRMVCHFFFKSGSENQTEWRNAICLFLYQLISRESKLASTVLAQHQIKGEILFQEVHALSRLFLLVMAEAQTLYRQIVCVIDALDEGESATQDLVARDLGKLCAKEAVKFLVMSRPNTNLQRGSLIQSMIRIKGEDEFALLTSDISTMIDTEVECLRAEYGLAPESCKLLAEKVKQKSARTFLWVSLVFKMLRGPANHSMSWKSIEKKLNEIPKELKDVYEYALSQSPDIRETKKALSIILAAYYPLSLEELNIILRIGDARTIDELKMVLEPESQIEFTVRGLCGIFASITNRRVYLIHETARVFLNSFGSLGTLGSHIALRDAHEIIARGCITYLRIVGYQKRWSDRAGFLLYSYASRYWMDHDLDSRKVSDDPEIDICSKYGLGVPRKIDTLITDLYDPDAPYGIPRTRMVINDVDAVKIILECQISIIMGVIWASNRRGRIVHDIILNKAIQTRNKTVAGLFFGFLEPPVRSAFLRSCLEDDIRKRIDFRSTKASLGRERAYLERGWTGLAEWTYLERERAYLERVRAFRERNRASSIYDADTELIRKLFRELFGELSRELSRELSGELCTAGEEFRCTTTLNLAESLLKAHSERLAHPDISRYIWCLVYGLSHSNDQKTVQSYFLEWVLFMALQVFLDLGDSIFRLIGSMESDSWLYLGTLKASASGYGHEIDMVGSAAIDMVIGQLDTMDRDDILSDIWAEAYEGGRHVPFRNLGRYDLARYLDGKDVDTPWRRAVIEGRHDSAAYFEKHGARCQFVDIFAICSDGLSCGFGTDGFLYQNLDSEIGQGYYNYLLRDYDPKDSDDAYDILFAIFILLSLAMSSSYGDTSKKWASAVAEFQFCSTLVHNHPGRCLRHLCPENHEYTVYGPCGGVVFNQDMMIQRALSMATLIISDGGIFGIRYIHRLPGNIWRDYTADLANIFRFLLFYSIWIRSPHAQWFLNNFGAITGSELNKNDRHIITLLVIATRDEKILPEHVGLLAPEDIDQFHDIIIATVLTNQAKYCDEVLKHVVPNLDINSSFCHEPPNLDLYTPIRQFIKRWELSRWQSFQNTSPEAYVRPWCSYSAAVPKEVLQLEQTIQSFFKTMVFGPDSFYISPLGLATCHQNYEVMAVLLSYGADPWMEASEARQGVKVQHTSALACLTGSYFQVSTSALPQHVFAAQNSVSRLPSLGPDLASTRQGEELGDVIKTGLQTDLDRPCNMAPWWPGYKKSNMVVSCAAPPSGNTATTTFLGYTVGSIRYIFDLLLHKGAPRADTGTGSMDVKMESSSPASLAETLAPSSLPEFASTNENEMFHVSFSKAVEAMKIEIPTNLNKQGNITGKTLLHYAVDQCNKSVVGFLLSSGADTSVQDFELRTALHAAVSLVPSESSLEIIKQVIKNDKSSSSGKMDQSGRIPYEIAKELHSGAGLYWARLSGILKEAELMSLESIRKNWELSVREAADLGSQVVGGVVVDDWMGGSDVDMDAWEEDTDNSLSD